MRIEQILETLDGYAGPFPVHLVAECVARREETTPLLLQILERLADDPEAWPGYEDRMAHIYALYMLALFREKRAYPLMVRIFSEPGEEILELTGDAVLNNGTQMLASVCDGDPGGIKALIENEQANAYIRSIAMEALVKLVAAGRLTRREVVEYFLGLFRTMERTPGYQWDSLAMACTDLWPREFMDELELAYDEGLVDESCLEWEEITEALAQGMAACLHQSSRRGAFITDLAQDMGWMQAFSTDHRREAANKPGHPVSGPQGLPGTATRKASPKVGRNDPCPCGSGKKLKECCGAN
jgi:hypothetical protein